MEQDYIIIGFSKAKGCMPISKAIMLVEGTTYSHAYIKVYNKHFNDIDIYQASKGMVNHITEKVFLQHNEIIKEYKIPISQSKKLETVNFLRQRLGLPYSIRTMLAIFIIGRLKKIGIKWSLFNKMFDGEKAYICSELVARVLKDCNIIPVNIEVDKATPKQVMTILEEYERNK